MDFWKNRKRNFTCFFGTLVIAGSLSATAYGDGITNANLATADELASIEGIEQFLDQADITTIVSGRPFSTIGELNSVLSRTMTKDQLEMLYQKIFIPINLNTASRENILLIPGVSRRMAHEFEEYRPYSNLEQFRREIGKYVNEQEVLRLQMYVTLD
jgi:DNA uptake protein ComE-like DNA-binding protein